MVGNIGGQFQLLACSKGLWHVETGHMVTSERLKCTNFKRWCHALVKYWVPKAAPAAVHQIPTFLDIR
jgi:hypothetical protein